VGTFLGFPFDVWVPMRMAPALGADASFDARGSTWLEMVGRLAPGMTLPAARARMATLAARLARAYPDSERGVGYDLRPVTGFEDSLRGAAVGFFTILAALAGLVLAVACVNVTGILFSRASSREREIGVRMALGAGRPRVVRFLAAETVVLFLAGGGLGALLTTATAPQLERFRLPIALPITFDFTPGPRVVAFALIAALAGGLVFGPLNALSATRGVDTATLRSGASTERRRASRLRSIFVSVQVAAAVLLVTAGLFSAPRRAAAADPASTRGVYRPAWTFRCSATTRPGARVLRPIDRTGPGLAGVESAAGVFPLAPFTRTMTVNLPARAAPKDGISVLRGRPRRSSRRCAFPS
jgi:hypothetical protein